MSRRIYFLLLAFALAVPTASPGDVRENPKDGLKYVWIPPGSYMMGCSPGDAACRDDERPSHSVTISKGFWMGQTEVTVGAYKRFANRTRRSMPREEDRFGRQLNRGWSDNAMPIVNVTWSESQQYCSWAGDVSPPKPSGNTRRAEGPPRRVMGLWMKWLGMPTTAGESVLTVPQSP